MRRRDEGGMRNKGRSMEGFYRQKAGQPSETTPEVSEVYLCFPRFASLRRTLMKFGSGNMNFI